MIARCRHLGACSNTRAAACRCVPTIERVPRARRLRQITVRRVVRYALARRRYATTIRIERHRVRVRSPTRVQRLRRDYRNCRACRHFRATTCRCVPTVECVPSASRRGQVAVGRVVCYTLARRCYATATCVKCHRVLVRSPLSRQCDIFAIAVYSNNRAFHRVLEGGTAA